MAEIEHFCDPSDKSHSKFSDVENTVMKLYSACNQMDGQPPISITIGQAVSQVQITFIKPYVCLKNQVIIFYLLLGYGC